MRASRGVRVALASAIMALMVVPLSLSAQTRTEGYIGGAGVFETYSFSDEDQVGIKSVSLFTIPFGAGLRIGERLGVEVFGTFASGTVEVPGGLESTLSGVTDTDVTVTLDLVPDALTLSGVFSAPTGSSTQNAEESVVAGVVAADLLPFRVSNWGSGGAVGLQLAGTQRFEGFGAGLSVAYQASGDFEPVDGNSATYEPGDLLRVRLALDTEIGRGGKGSLIVGLQRFDEDAFDGSSLFESGNRFEVTGSYAFPTGFRSAGVVYAGVLHRAEGTAIGGAVPDAPSQDLILFGGQLRTALGSTWFRPRVDGRLFRSDDGVGQGYVIGVGSSLELSSGSATWIPLVTARFGNVEVADGFDSGFTGVEAGLTVRFGR